MKKSIIIIGAIILLLNISLAGIWASYKNESNGFGGIVWGANISTLKGFEFSKGDSYLIVYKRASDYLGIGDATVDSIEYATWKGKFVLVEIAFSGDSNWIAIKKAMTTKYGNGPPGNMPCENMFWKGKATNITLYYDANAGQGMLMYAPIASVIKKLER